MKKLVLSLAILATIFTGCGSDDSNPGPVVPTTGELSGNITEDMTLNAGTLYTLRGATYVKEGVTLTIPAGTRIEADAAFQEVAFLAVEKGGKILAQGTAENPIVFTSNAASPAPQDWGGLVICGNAVTNLGTNVQAEVTGLTYGGTNAADNSGIFSHIIVEYSGNLINDEAEFNGVTFYAVGSGTTVNNILVYQGSDDGFEWFGGSVNATNLAAIGCQDDSFDWTEGWNGTASNLYSDQSTAIAASADSRGVEADNNTTNPLLAPISSPTLSNITLIGRGLADVAKEGGMWLRRGTHATVTNAYIANFNSTASGAGFGINFDGTDSQTFFTANPLQNVTITDVTTADNLSGAGYQATTTATGAGSGAAQPTWMDWMGL
ncbi:MAG: hypothetical protein EOO50_00065 [Flavobacterium sp.]|uniref:hypothetical protein n=1 Tax=Flavobacterium sp. TaxID=239 RepID=UPI0012251B6B|nr:hypothetical protein [Flavobacterium sp.]RZJ68610.1 MAG: hypothetical protein EOO50_00065 [Flavobacterium sp.]